MLGNLTESTGTQYIALTVKFLQFWTNMPAQWWHLVRKGWDPKMHRAIWCSPLPSLPFSHFLLRLNHGIKLLSLPGHAEVLQSWSSAVEPEQSEPEPNLGGFVQVLDLDWVPTPQVFEQTDQAPNVAHFPCAEKSVFILISKYNHISIFFGNYTKKE